MKKILFAIAALAALCSCGPKAPELTKSGINPADFQAEYNGKATELYTLTNANGMEVCITNFGARLVSIMVPDNQGEFKDVVLGFDNVTDYFPENHANNFGATIGRYANRICDGKFSIDGKEYTLPQNNKGHCLHGGTGFHNSVFDLVEKTDNSVKLSISSPDGENGFPGNVTASITYTLLEENAIKLSYEATTDAPTVINMTNHSYFNLAGDPANHCVEDDYVVINASNFTPVGETLITTGEIVPVEGTPMDFRKPKRVGQDINTGFEQTVYGRGFDHNWVLDTNRSLDVPAAICICPETGIVFAEYTDEPGMQVYTGNFLDGSVNGKKGACYDFRHAICFESQKYPDTPNKPQWPSALVLPGQTYTSTAIFAFSTMKPCCLQNIVNGSDECLGGGCEGEGGCEKDKKGGCEKEGGCSGDHANCAHKK